MELVTDPRARCGIPHTIASTLAMVVAAGLPGAERSFRSARNTAISLMRLAGCINITRGLEYVSRRLCYVLTLLGVLPEGKLI